MRRGWKAWRRPLRDIGLIALVLYGVSYLPPDTSLRDRQAGAVLRFCVPDIQSGLISGADGSPGPELRLMQGVAADLSLQLQLVQIDNMGRSFNPSDWHITRGQCDILGGGLSDSAVNRGFLAMLPHGGQIGLQVTADPAQLSAGTEIGVYLGSAGLDRVRLSGWMRSLGLRAKPLHDVAALQAWLKTGRPAIASSLVPLPDDLLHWPLPEAAADTSALAFGLWRGDMTLIRTVRNSLRRQLAI